MTQEEKQLLLKDLCARLVYHPVIYGKEGVSTNEGILTLVTTSGVHINTKGGCTHFYFIEEIKPYLRPMSSMTEEEMTEMHTMLSPTGTAVYKCDGLSTPVSHFGDFIPYEYMSRVIDWLNAHHFDYRGLIPIGLALPATEGMYN